MVTRYDVASKAGVSPATVSHVMNKSKYVSPQLTHKVQEAIEELSYTPNIIARSLVTKSTKHVGILANDITNPYYGEIAQGMEEVARKHGYIISLFFAEGNNDDYFSSILQRQLDGMFFATISVPFNETQIKTFYQAGTAVVNGNDNIGSRVYFDYTTGIMSAVKYLSDMGHRRIGFISGFQSTSPVEPRLQAYMDAVRRYGLEFDDRFVVYGEFPYYTTHHSGYTAMQELLRREMRVTAVMTTNDLMAFGAFRAIHEAGLRIPGDISVVGCDDIFLAECIDPPLTTLRGRKKELGRQAMNLILNEIKEKKSVILKMDVDLVIRNSTGPVPKG